MIELALGALLMAALALHDWRAIQEGRFADCFWLCNVSAALLAVGWMLASARLISAAATWLLPGCLVWLADVWLAHSNIIPTSYAVHLGGAALALLGARRFGVPRRTWLASLALLGVVLVFSRLFLPEAANINAVHAVPPGWGALGESRGRFIISAALLTTGCAVCFSWLLKIVAGKPGRASVSRDEPSGNGPRQ